MEAKYYNRCTYCKEKVFGLTIEELHSNVDVHTKTKHPEEYKREVEAVDSLQWDSILEKS